MPWIAFLANGLWVMVIGLMGPSLPAIIQDYGITYGQAGLIFTSLSAGSLLGTFFGGFSRITPGEISCFPSSPSFLPWDCFSSGFPGATPCCCS